MKDILKDDKHFAPYFQRDEVGREIFYPWGSPGEGYYVEEQQKQKLKFAMRTLFWASLLSFPVIYLFLQFASNDQHRFDWLLLVALMMYLAMYVVSAYFMTKNMVACDSRNYNLSKQRIPNLVKQLLKFTALALLIATCSWMYNPDDTIAKITLLTVSVICPLLIFFAWIRRGYIFQQSPTQI